MMAFTCIYSYVFPWFRETLDHAAQFRLIYIIEGLEVFADEVRLGCKVNFVNFVAGPPEFDRCVDKELVG